jgi:hypothetical protein
MISVSLDNGFLGEEFLKSRDGLCGTIQGFRETRELYRRHLEVFVVCQSYFSSCAGAFHDKSRHLLTPLFRTETDEPFLAR